jgi:hypothetical protein
MNQEVKVSENGNEYTIHSFHKKDDDGKIVETLELRLFRNMNMRILTEENETKEETKLRRQVVNNLIKKHKRGNVVWSPYPFGRQEGTPGLTCNENNRAVIEGIKKKQEEENGGE